MEKKIFSISNKNKQVLDILNTLNKNETSNYICEAIIEKYERDSKNSIENIQNDFKTEIRAILDEYLRDLKLETSTINTETEKEPITETKDNTNLLISMMDSWDND